MKHYIKVLVFMFIFIPILLFSQQWTDNYRITTTPTGSLTGISASRQITFSNEGLVHIVWKENHNGNFIIHYARSTNYGETWPLQLELSQPDMSSVNPSIAVSGNIVHVVWNIWTVPGSPEQGPVFYRRSRDQGSTWDDNECLDLSEMNVYPTITAAADINTVNVVWWDFLWGLRVKHSSNQGEIWDTTQTIYMYQKQPEDLGPPSITCAGTFPQVHIAATRTSNLFPEPYWADVIYIRSNDGGITWEDYRTIPSSYNNNVWHSEQSIVANYNTVHIVWKGASLNYPYTWFIKHVSSLDGGDNWGEVTTVRSSDEVELYDPSITIDKANILHLVWTEWLSGNSEIYYKRYNKVFGWQSTYELVREITYHRPYVSIAWNPYISTWTEENGLYLIWTDEIEQENTEIFFKRGWQISENATHPNQGRHLVRVINRWDLNTIFQGEGAIFDQALFGNCAPPTPMVINTPVGLDQGKQPSNAITDRGSSWVCYSSRMEQTDSLFCLIQRNPQNQDNWRKIGIYSADSIFTPSLIHAIARESRDNNMGYVVYTTKEQDHSYIRFSAFDSMGSWYDVIIDEGNVSSPSIAITPGDFFHIVWQKDDRIYYKTTLEKITPELIRQGEQPLWSEPFNVSYTNLYPTEPASNPFVEAQGEWIYIAWRGPNEEGNSVYGDIWQRQGELHQGNLPEWREPRNVSNSLLRESNFPSMSTATAVVWQEESLPGLNQIYGEIQGQIRNLSNNQFNCKYPHTNVVPTEPWYLYCWRLLTVWTQEKMPGIYQINYGRYDFDRRWDHEEPPIAVDCGEIDPSQYCLDRTGYIDLGDFSVDYGTELQYKIPYLHPEKYYLLEAICYNDTASREKFVFEDSATKTIQIYPEDPETLRIVLRPNQYDDAEMLLKVRKMIGEYAVVANLRLYEFEMFGGSGSGPQSLMAYDNYDFNTSLLTHTLFPNPFNNSTTIRYSLPYSSKVKLLVYDVQGRAIRTLINETQQIGVYEQIWDAKDCDGEKVPNGIYFYRIETENESVVNKVVFIR